MLVAIISACEPTRKRAWQAHRVFTGSVGEAPADARTGKPAPLEAGPARLASGRRVPEDHLPGGIVAGRGSDVAVDDADLRGRKLDRGACRRHRLRLPRLRHHREPDGDQRWTAGTTGHRMTMQLSARREMGPSHPVRQVRTGCRPRPRPVAPSTTMGALFGLFRFAVGVVHPSSDKRCSTPENAACKQYPSEDVVVIHPSVYRSADE